MAVNNSYLAFLEFRLGGPLRKSFFVCLLFTILLGCDRRTIPSEELAVSNKMAKEVAALNWAKVENSFEQILAGAHIKTSNTSWIDEQGKAIASHTASYQVYPKASGQGYLLLHSDSSSVDGAFDWPKQRAALRWLNNNPYPEIRVDSSVFKSARVIEKYVFTSGASADASILSHKLEGRVDQDVVFDNIEIKSLSASSDIESVKYVRLQDGFLFKEQSAIEIDLDNDKESTIPVSFSVDSKVNPILLDPLHVRTEVSYKILSDPDN